VKSSRIESLNLAREGIAPNRELYGLYVTLLNKPGVIQNLLKKLTKNRVRLVCINTPSMEFTRPHMTVFLVGDFTKAYVGIDDFIQKLRQDRTIVSIERASEITKGVIIDTKHFPLTIHDMRVIMMGEIVLRPLVTTIRDKMKFLVDVVLWHTGYAIGIELTKLFKDTYGISKPCDYFAVLAARTIELGWGYVEEVKLNQIARTVKFSIQDLWECSFSKPSEKPQSHIYRGILAGMASVVFKTDMIAEEKMCIAKGDNKCLFIVRPK